MTPERKRDLLVALCDAQRENFGMLVAQLDAPFKIADTGFRVVRYVRERPLLVTAISALLAARRGRSLFKWAQRGVVAWRAYRTLVR